MNIKNTKKIYRLMSGHVIIYKAGGLAQTGVISRYAFLRIMNILEKELGQKKRRRKLAKSKSLKLF